MAAMKCVKHDEADLPKGMTRERCLASLVEEVQQLRAYMHANIVRAHGLCYAALSEPRAVLELCRGGSLDQRIEAEEWGARRGEAGWRVATGFASALVYLHGLPMAVVHLDVKPGNVLLADGGTPKLADFGCSSVRARDAAPLTTRWGTREFRAPEVWKGEAVTGAADVYSFAALLVCLATRAQSPYARVYTKDELRRRVLQSLLKPAVDRLHPWAEVVDMAAAHVADYRLKSKEVLEKLEVAA